MWSEAPAEHDKVPASTRAAAIHLHITPGTVRRRLRRGQLPGIKDGHRWRVWLASSDEQNGAASVAPSDAHGPADTWHDIDPSRQAVVAMLRQRLREQHPEAPRRPLWSRLLVWRG